jgi:hypothetical protein
MDNINIKVKDKVPSDKSILTHKNFSSVIDQHNIIKSSYAKVASIWGATIGMTVFLVFAASETIDTNTHTKVKPKETYKYSAAITSLSSQEKPTDLSIEKITTPESTGNLQTNTISSQVPQVKQEIKAGSTIEEKTNKIEVTKKINMRYIPE